MSTDKLYTAEQVDRALFGYLEHTSRLLAVAALMEQPEGHEARTLRYRKKQLGHDLGRAGNRIYDLRCQLVESRACNEIDPTAYRGLLARLRDAERRVDELEGQLKEAADVAVDAQEV